MSINKDIQMSCLKNFLIRCCYWYYVKTQPIVSDQEYDIEFRRLEKLEQELENDYGLKPDKDSPTQMIWGDCESQYPEWAKENMTRIIDSNSKHIC